jgi:uncharacterized protein
VTRVRAAAWAVGAPLRFLLVMAIRLYRVTLGSLVGGQCRFHPSCSVYGEEAIGELGVLRGVPLTVWRVLRCSPLSRGGVDYPPGHADRAGRAQIRATTGVPA